MMLVGATAAGTILTKISCFGNRVKQNKPLAAAAVCEPRRVSNNTKSPHAYLSLPMLRSGNVDRSGPLEDEKAVLGIQ
jgi:hypothetical protein